MKLSVLGGAAAGGNTGSGCSGYLLHSRNTRLVVDLGPGTLQELRKHCDFRAIDGIVISHWHVDHFLDLASLRFAAAYNPRPTTNKIPLFMPPEGAGLLSRFGETLTYDEPDPHFFDDIFAISEFDPHDDLTIGDFTLRFQPTVHFVPCWAIRIADGLGNDVGYTADTGPLPELENFFQGVDLLIAEATDIERDPDMFKPGHLTATEAGSLATACGAQLLILTHMWEEHGFDMYLAGARNSYSGEIRLAQPGLTMDIGSPQP